MVLKRLIAPLVALALATGVALSAPAVSTWEYTTVRIWPPASRGIGSAAGDTMTRQLSASDSIDVTDSVSVFGARVVHLLVQSNATDSMSVPILQMQLPNGQWSGAGGSLLIPPSGGSQTKPLAATTAITTTTQFAWSIYNEATQGGTPVPFTNTYFRWRVKSTDARRYSAPSSATLSSTGKYQIWAVIGR